MAPLTIGSLNTGRGLGATPTEVSATERWMQTVAQGKVQDLPWVMCLQDVRISHVALLAAAYPHFHFAPMTNHKIWGKRELVGVAIMSQLPLQDIAIAWTHGDGMTRDLEGVDDKNQRIEPPEEADRLVLATENRVAVAATVDVGGPIRILTHHGFWTRAGEPTAEQAGSTLQLLSFAEDQYVEWGNVVMIGDWNFDREGKMLRSFEEEGWEDCLAPSIETTVSPDHPGYKFKVKPDRIFRYYGSTAFIDGVQVTDEGKSDHLMLRATLVM